MRKNNNRNNNMKHRSNNNGGQRRYNNGGGNGGGNRGGNDSGNIARQKHHATQQLGKYSDMARNAQINGDRVDVEYYLQHVDHYTRVLTDIAVIEAERHAHHREQQIVPGGPNDSSAQQADANHVQDGQSQQAAEGNSGGEGQDAASGESAVAAEQPVRAPRPPRQPRRQYNAPAASDNGAAEANSNTTEIPLPGGILPPV